MTFFKANFLKIVWLAFGFAFLVSVYSYYGNKVYFSYHDEAYWIGKSYYFQFLTAGDFRREIWESYAGIDEPMLAMYAYGAWLYPDYLYAKKVDPGLDYTKFLIKRGFYWVDNDLPEYKDYEEKNKESIFELPQSNGSFQDIIDRNGEKSQGTADLILKARSLNYFMLAFAVLYTIYVVFPE